MERYSHRMALGAILVFFQQGMATGVAKGESVGPGLESHGTVRTFRVTKAEDLALPLRLTDGGAVAAREPFAGDRTLYRPTEASCDFSAFVICSDTSGLVLRDSPGGTVVAELGPTACVGSGVVARVLAYHASWFSVVLGDGRGGWVEHGRLGLHVGKDTPGSVAALRVRPEEDAPAQGEIFGAATVSVIGGQGRWALVSYHHPKGHVLSGWLDPRLHCPDAAGCR
jgi:hypothetical protein